MTKTAMNPEKLAKLQEQVRIGGKGTPRRKIRKPQKPAGDDKKLSTTFKKIGIQPIPSIDEVNMFLEDETVLHVSAPKGMALCLSVSPSSRCCKHIYRWRHSRIQRHALCFTVELTELAPGIIEQLSPESLDRLRQMANAYLQMSKSGAVLNEDNIPELIENFEAQSLVDRA